MSRSKTGIYNSIAENDYNSVILSLLKKYCPPGLLGLALTALLASFMSGMAGNVTAFNTIWTYDLYQAYFVRNKSDAHYFWMGKFITVVGILISICCAYVAKQYNNAMDIIQLVFGFVNAPGVRHLPAGHVLETNHRRRGVSSDCSAALPPRRFFTRSPPPPAMWMPPAMSSTT